MPLGGGEGVGRLMANAIKNFHIFREYFSETLSSFTIFKTLIGVGGRMENENYVKDGTSKGFSKISFSKVFLFLCATIHIES